MKFKVIKNKKQLENVIRHLYQKGGYIYTNFNILKIIKQVK